VTVTDEPIVFIDCETTSLRPDRRAWEVAVILRRPDRPDQEESWFVEWHDLDLGNADLASLKFGRFYERRPQGRRCAGGYVLPPAEEDVLLQVEEWTRGAILMGSNPSFDAETLAARMRARGICPSWRYHLEDVANPGEGLAVRGREAAAGEVEVRPNLARLRCGSRGLRPPHGARGLPVDEGPLRPGYLRGGGQMNFLKRFMAERRIDDEEKVVAAIGKLRPSQASAPTISRLAHIRLRKVYGVLTRLERAGRIAGDWTEGPQPRRRIYRVVKSAVTR
jgi:hypothetical protein